MFKCNHCNKEYDTFNGLAKHSAKAHNVSGMELYMLTHNIIEIPKCKCGCGQEVNFQLGKFGEFIRGHKARMTGGFYSEAGLEKAAATRKKQFASGERIQWNKGKKYNEQQLAAIQEAAKSPERRKKISESLTGKKKSPEHIAKIQADRKKYWSDRDHQLQQRERRMQYIINNGLGYSSNLEKEFSKILDSLSIEYIDQFYAREIKALYDFKIKGKNILIEVDGDYWHCNPNIEKFKTPTHQWHHDNLLRDALKNKWAEENGYELLRFWETDIRENRFECIKRLMEIVK